MKKQTKSTVLQIFFCFTALVYILVFLRVSLFKYTSLPELLFSTDRFYTRGLNLIPFASDGAHGYRFILEPFLNFLLYFPLGFLLSMKVTGKKHSGYFLLIPFGVSLLIEAIQYALYLGAADVTDVMMNTAGGIVGFLTYAVLMRLFSKKQEQLDTVLTVCMLVVAAVVLIFYLLGTNWSAYKLFL